jgi:prepilin-type N-terminal cleavage/methylation domain-containing protein/prepilin-type processing-associated H-X9-DG protein
MSQKKGFTLVELLVVISIIALLLSIMMPALSKVREQANSVVCRSNLKQLVLGASLWSSGNDDWMVASSWFRSDPFESPHEEYSNPSSLQSYISANLDNPGDVMVCPSAKREEFTDFDYLWGDQPQTVPQNRRSTYSVNGYTACYLTTHYDGRPKSPGTLPLPGVGGPATIWEGPKGSRGWGIYLYLHGSTKVMNVRRPGETLYFIDQDYPISSIESLNPLIPRERVDYQSASRWHEKKSVDYGNGPTNYGYGNIGWVDGHAGREPKDFTEVPDWSKVSSARYWYYYWDH